MDLQDKLKQFSKRADNLKLQISNEEATKTSLIMPFIQMLGYDVFNPEEFIPEFTADVGIKKGEKVDYAIKIDGNLVMLIEAKSVTEKLDNHDSQLFRYFTTTKAKFGILTNGLIYKFYTDLDEQNKMDDKPFMTINILDLKDRDIDELTKFTRQNFDMQTIFNTAEELKYCSEIKQALSNEYAAPSDSFVTHILNDIYPGRKTQSIVDKFKPIVSKAFKEFINDLISKKIETAFEKESPRVPVETIVDEAAASDEKVENKIMTTEEELEGLFIIKSILRNANIDTSLINHKDTESYFGILFDNNTRKWICRLAFNSSQKYLILNIDKDNREKVAIDKVDDILNYSDKILEITKTYLT